MMQPYETEIAIRYDDVTHLASVNLHGLEIFLQEHYPSRDLALRAGEAFCRRYVHGAGQSVTAGAGRA